MSADVSRTEYGRTGAWSFGPWGSSNVRAWRRNVCGLSLVAREPGEMDCACDWWVELPGGEIGPNGCASTPRRARAKALVAAYIVRALRVVLGWWPSAEE